MALSEIVEWAVIELREAIQSERIQTKLYSEAFTTWIVHEGGDPILKPPMDAALAAQARLTIATTKLLALLGKE